MKQVESEMAVRAFADDPWYEEGLNKMLSDLKEGPVQYFFIDINRDSEESSDGDERTQRTADRIDTLCEALGITATGKWSSALVEGVSLAYFQRLERSGLSIGMLMTRLAFERLPMEDDPDDDTVESTITFRARDAYLLQIHIEGHIWKNYFLEGDSDLIDELDNEEFINHPESTSSLEWENNYWADILPGPTPSVDTEPEKS